MRVGIAVCPLALSKAPFLVLDAGPKNRYTEQYYPYVLKILFIGILMASAERKYQNQKGNALPANSTGILRSSIDFRSRGPYGRGIGAYATTTAAPFWVKKRLSTQNRARNGNDVIIITLDC